MEQKNLSEMKWEKIEKESNFIAIESLEVGKEIIGIYLGSEPSINYPNSKNHKIEVDGQIRFMSSVVLDSKLANVKAGTPIRVVALGKARGKRYYDFDVYTSKV